MESTLMIETVNDLTIKFDSLNDELEIIGEDGYYYNKKFNSSPYEKIEKIKYKDKEYYVVIMPFLLIKLYEVDSITDGFILEEIQLFDDETNETKSGYFVAFINNSDLVDQFNNNNAKSEKMKKLIEAKKRAEEDLNNSLLPLLEKAILKYAEIKDLA